MLIEARIQMAPNPIKTINHIWRLNFSYDTVMWSFYLLVFFFCKISDLNLMFWPFVSEFYQIGGAENPKLSINVDHELLLKIKVSKAQLLPLISTDNAVSGW